MLRGNAALDKFGTPQNSQKSSVCLLFQELTLWNGAEEGFTVNFSQS